MRSRKRYLLNRLFIIQIFVSLLPASDREKLIMSSSSVNFSSIEFEVIAKGESNNRFIWLHGDEKTANLAIRHHLKHYDGTAFLVKSKAREVPYRDTKIDPNRIFSRSGSFKAIKKFKPEWAPGTIKVALDELDQNRSQFLTKLFPDSGGVLIAVHNNFRGYNLKSELENSTKVSLNPKENPRDFIICTDPDDFEKLSVGTYNVVLQDRPPEKDNGSLSWAAFRNGIRYVNVETRLGWLSKQKKMLEFVEESLQ